MNIQEGFTYLSELLRTAYDLISPNTYHNQLDLFKDREKMEELYNKCPSCFLTLLRKDKGIVYFPLCNKMNIEDPKLINFSITFAGKLNGNENIDEEDLKNIMIKLQRLKNKFSKPIPKTTRMAILKGNSTRQLHKIKKYLNK